MKKNLRKEQLLRYSFSLILFLNGCASHTIRVNSDVPSRIEINGVTVCESTPCDIVNSCGRHGEASQLMAYPLDRNTGYSQEKTVAPDCHMGSSNLTPVFFEMGARKGIAVEQSTLDSVDAKENEKIKKLKFLKKAKEDSLITEDQYKKKVEKILDSK